MFWEMKFAILVDEEKPAGSYEIEFNAAELPSGIYFYRLRVVHWSKPKRWSSFAKATADKC